jgi:hypothetical protein
VAVVVRPRMDRAVILPGWIDRKRPASFNYAQVLLQCKELFSNVVDCLNQAADFLTPFSNLIPNNTSAINSEPSRL